jgi:hypothetical protein
MANGNYKQKFLDIQRDLERKIKEEEKRAIYIQSMDDFRRYARLI